MKKINVLLFMLASVPSMAALITFERVTTYTDNTNISSAKVPTIQYRGYYGMTQTGPWTAGDVVTDNLAITAPDPAKGETLWYTVDATLDGVTSGKATPASKTTPYPTPSPPLGCTVK